MDIDDTEPIRELNPLSPAHLEELAWERRASEATSCDSDQLRELAKQLSESAKNLQAESEKLERRAAEMDASQTARLP